jgi:hypothetical protein
VAQGENTLRALFRNEYYLLGTTKEQTGISTSISAAFYLFLSISKCYVNPGVDTMEKSKLFQQFKSESIYIRIARGKYGAGDPAYEQRVAAAGSG